MLGIYIDCWNFFVFLFFLWILTVFVVVVIFSYLVSWWYWALSNIIQCLLSSCEGVWEWDCNERKVQTNDNSLNRNGNYGEKMNIYIFIIYPFDIHKPKRILLSISKDEKQKKYKSVDFSWFSSMFCHIRNAKCRI